MGFGPAGFIFEKSCRVGYGYWSRGSGPWAVRVSKKSARAISTVYQHFPHEVSKFCSKVAVEDFQDCDASGVARNFKRGGHNFNIFQA